MRGGRLGGLAAWAGFTLPSAVLMLLFAYGAASLADSWSGVGLLHGLKLVAVAIVAQAVMGMARTLCPDRPRASIATAASCCCCSPPARSARSARSRSAASAGWRSVAAAANEIADDLAMPVGRRLGFACLAAFFALLALSFVPVQGGLLALFAAFYRSGALVFGGGHVVLPLLRDAVVAPGWVSDNAFLAGYGAAQAVPGPLFTFAAYLGALTGAPPAGVAGDLVALVAIFLPGVLLLMAALPFWDALRALAPAQAAMRGVNAAVVGLLGAALYNPVWTSAVQAPADLAVAATGFVLLTVWRAPPLVVALMSPPPGSVWPRAAERSARVSPRS